MRIQHDRFGHAPSAPVDTHALLHAYSEWLDEQGLVSPDDGDDQRSHDDLVGDFLAQRNA